MSIGSGCREELSRLRRTPFDLALLTIAPVLLLASMAAMIFPGSLHCLGVIVVDRDGGPTARAIVRNIIATPTLDLVGETPDIGAAMSAIRRERAVAVLVIPQGLDARRPGTQPVELFYEAQFLAAGSLTSTFVELATAAALAGSAAGASAGAALASLRPLLPGVHVRLLGNPTLSLEWYLGLLLGPGVLHLAIAVTMIGSLGLLLEDGSFAAFARRTPAPVATLAGRLIPHVLMGTLLGIAWFLWMTLVRDYRFEGPIVVVAFALLLLNLATAGLALLLIAVTRNTATSLSGAVIIAGSALAYSGASLPINGAPLVARIWNAVVPLTHYLHMQMDVAIDASARPLLIEAAALLLYPLVAGGIGMVLIARSGRREGGKPA